MVDFHIEFSSLDNTDEQRVTVKVVGNLLQSTLTNDFIQTIEPANRRQISSANEAFIDFSETKRIDTAGLAWVLNMAANFKKQNIRFKFGNIPEQLLNLASLSNAKELLIEFSEP